MITNKEKGPTILCFRDTNYDMLSKAWYENRGSDPEKERLRQRERTIPTKRKNQLFCAFETQIMICYPKHGMKTEDRIQKKND